MCYDVSLVDPFRSRGSVSVGATGPVVPDEIVPGQKPFDGIRLVTDLCRSSRVGVLVLCLLWELLTGS